MSFNKQNLGQIRLDINAALAVVAKKHNIASLTIGNIGFTENDFHTKLTAIAASATGEAPANARELKWAKDFKNHAFQWGLASSALGKEVTVNGDTYTLAGARPRAKNPILLKTKEGKFFTYPAFIVKAAFDLQAA
jgi:hypothetical protein